jgi:hypothetical protein
MREEYYQFFNLNERAIVLVNVELKPVEHVWSPRLAVTNWWTQGKRPVSGQADFRMCQRPGHDSLPDRTYILNSQLPRAATFHHCSHEDLGHSAALTNPF